MALKKPTKVQFIRAVAETLKQPELGKMADALERGDCPFCGKTPKLDEFADELSLKEYGISGLCQDCQDNMFGKDDRTVKLGAK